jgi:transposase-like protein
MGADVDNSQQHNSQSPRRWTTEHKLRVVVEASRLDDAELGAFLRREGLHQAQLTEWRQLLDAALTTPKPSKRSKSSPDAKRIHALEKELRRKEKALAELAALLTLKKNMDAYWGVEDDDTNSKSDA